MVTETRIPALWALPAILVSAVLFHFGMGFEPVAGLALLAPLPVLLLAPRVSAGTACVAAFLAFLLSTVGDWSFYLVSHDEPPAIGALISFGFSTTLLISVALFRALIRRGHAMLATLAVPAAWTGVLFLVSLSPRGIVGTLATAQTDVPVLLQTATVAGAWGVEFLGVFVPTAVAALCAPGVASAARLRTGVVAALLLAVALGGGALRLASAQDGPAQRVALIADDAAGWAPVLGEPAGRATLSSYVDEISSLPSDVDTVVLPEAALGADTDADVRTIVGALRRVAAERKVTVVAGVQRYVADDKYNRALTFPAGGAAPVDYLKMHDTVSKLGHDLVFAPGTRTGVAICADVNFPNPSSAYALAGSRMLALPASDETTNGWQHGRTALLRGVENGQSTMWSARTGTLMVGDGYGRVVAEKSSGRFATLIADVRPGPGATPYSRFGDWFAWACVALAAGSILLLPFLRRRSRR